MARDDTSAGDSHASNRLGRDNRRTLALELDTFAWEALAEQSVELAVEVDELATFSVLYYLADRDSQRIARRLPAELRPPCTGR